MRGARRIVKLTQWAAWRSKLCGHMLCSNVRTVKYPLWSIANRKYANWEAVSGSGMRNCHESMVPSSGRVTSYHHERVTSLIMTTSEISYHENGEVSSWSIVNYKNKNWEPVSWSGMSHCHESMVPSSGRVTSYHHERVTVLIRTVSEIYCHVKIKISMSIVRVINMSIKKFLSRKSMIHYYYSINIAMSGNTCIGYGYKRSFWGLS